MCSAYEPQRGHRFWERKILKGVAITNFERPFTPVHFHKDTQRTNFLGDPHYGTDFFITELLIFYFSEV